jgi:hypothetical protein
MKYINDYKMFESLSAIQFSDIRDDVEGILIDLIDKGCYVDVYPGVVDLKQSNQPPNYPNQSGLFVPLNMDHESDGIIIKVGGTEKFKGSDIEDYVLTVLDYLKIKYTNDFNATYYTNSGYRWNTYSDLYSLTDDGFYFPQSSDYEFARFAISIKKNN